MYKKYLMSEATSFDQPTAVPNDWIDPCVLLDFPWEDLWAWISKILKWKITWPVDRIICIESAIYIAVGKSCGNGFN